jgi:hypothetical protein
VLIYLLFVLSMLSSMRAGFPAHHRHPFAYCSTYSVQNTVWHVVAVQEISAECMHEEVSELS